MNDAQKIKPGYVLVRNQFVVLDAEVNSQQNKLGKQNNNGRKILATDVIEEFSEIELSDPVWKVPGVFATGQGGIEVASFTEYAAQDRHKHKRGIEIYTVLKGTVEIFVNDQGPIVLNRSDEIIILPETIHEVVQKNRGHRPSFQEFDLLVRVHSINCFGEDDKYIQLHAGGDWKLWKELSKAERASAYRKQGALTRTGSHLHS